MEACHILFGRPWQFDRKSIHNGLLTKSPSITRKRNLYFILSHQVKWLTIKYKWNSRAR